MHQLDWYEERHWYGGLRADCPKSVGRGFYRISTYDGYQVNGHRLFDGYRVSGHRLCTNKTIFIGGKFATLDEAMAAAQTHLQELLVNLNLSPEMSLTGAKPDPVLECK
jgi:hypothetical protein